MNTQEQITKAFGKLADLYNNESTVEILVDGPDKVRIEKDGKITQ